MVGLGLGGKKTETEALMLALLLPALILCAAQHAQGQQVKIYISLTTVLILDEGQQYDNDVCQDSSSTNRVEVSFSLIPLPTISNLELPTHRRFADRCVTVTVRSRNNYVREDTQTSLIFLRTTSSTVGVDENRDHFILHVKDRSYGITADSCPPPAITNGHELSCSDHYEPGIVCTYSCNVGFQRLSGNFSRTCEANSLWSGYPLFCISNSCVNAVGIITCTCPTGYIQGGYTQTGSMCTDIDECQNYSLHNCEYPSSECKNTDGSYHCECRDGYTRNMNSGGQTSTCTDINECLQGLHSCNNITSECENRAGHYLCSCKSGYSGRTYYPSGEDTSTCEDIDECTVRLHSCNTLTSDCVNTAGGYYCRCKSGYSRSSYYLSGGDTSTCENIDECSPGQVHYCNTSTSECVDTHGEYYCRCKSGYSDRIYYPPRGQSSTCENIDECSQGRHSCDISTSQCVDTVGEYYCRCKSGYSGGRYYPPRRQSSTCENIDECSQGRHSCDISTSECVDTVGEYYCRCKSGYSGRIYYPSREDSSTCVDDIPPVISGCPQNLAVYIHAGQIQGAATWTEPTAYDVSGGVTVSQTHSPGDSFPLRSTQVRYTFRDPLNNMARCQFWVRVYTVDLICPSPVTISYGGVLSYTSPQCTINYSQTTRPSQTSCIPQNGRTVVKDALGVCSCNFPSHINCSFQITVQTHVECPSQMTISPGELLSYDIPRCMNSQGSREASCLPSTGSFVTTDTFVTCSCPQDGGIQCRFQIFIDCIALQDTFCRSSGSMCDCMDESCDPHSGICSSNCTIVNTCPASIESVSLSQVNPASSVDIICTLRGSTTILDRLQLMLSTKSDALRQVGITELRGREVITTGDKVQSTFRVNNVTKENTLYCVLFQQRTNRREFIGRVSVTDFVHDLPNLNDAPIHKNVSNTTITISWRAWDETVDDGDPPIVAYIPYYRRSAADLDEWISGPWILPNETHQFTADNLQVDTLYEFSVAVVREGENGEGPRSQPLAVKTLCNVPGVAASVNVQLTSSNKVNVSWQIPPGKMMCSTGVTSYKVYYRIEGSIDDTPELVGTVEDVDRRWFIVDEGLLQPESSYVFFVTVTSDQESGFMESEAIQAPVSGSPAGIIVAVLCITVLIIIVLLIILVIIKRKRDEKGNANTLAPNPVDNTYDNLFGNPIEHRQGAAVSNTAKPVFQMQLAEKGDHEKMSLESFSVDENSSPDEAIYGNLEPPQPIRVSEFKNYFKQNIDKFEQEFSILKGSKKQFDWTVAENLANKKKNRFKNIYTYDHSRVVLKSISDQEGSDYYNASFIKNANGVKAYIASQAPNKASVEDFIRMIWEQNVTTIVMVANLFEDGKERCHQYWPETEGSHKSFGYVTVTWLKTTKFSDFVIRYFSFKKGRKTHDVQQLHFLTWPDKDTPEHGTSLIEFTKQSKLLHRGRKYPMLVHCSAGIGRTGTFICLSSMMDVLRDKEYMDVFGFVNKMRQNRINMVQTSKQYVFLYKCLNEYHLTYQTEMSVRQMTLLNVDSQRGILLREFKLLSELVHNPQKDTEENCTGKKRENIARNRVRNMVPSNRNRVFLMSSGQSYDGNYINASYVKSFQKKDAFITTQSPLPYTTEDFWRMVYDVKSPLIVMLNQLDPTDTTCLKYWPDHGCGEYGNMRITCMTTDKQPSSYIQRTFDVKHVNSKEVLSVTHIQMKEWNPDINLEGIVSLFKDVDLMHKRSQSTQPVVVHCINGFDRSGIMVTVISELERITVTEKIDVFSTVKKLRDQHEHMLKNTDDYILCYHLLNAYLTGSNSEYENLEDIRRK